MLPYSEHSLQSYLSELSLIELQAEHIKDEETKEPYRSFFTSLKVFDIKMISPELQNQLFQTIHDLYQSKETAHFKQLLQKEIVHLSQKLNFSAKETQSDLTDDFVYLLKAEFGEGYDGAEGSLISKDETLMFKPKKVKRSPICFSHPLFPSSVGIVNLNQYVKKLTEFPGFIEKHGSVKVQELLDDCSLSLPVQHDKFSWFGELSEQAFLDLDRFTSLTINDVEIYSDQEKSYLKHKESILKKSFRLIGVKRKVAFEVYKLLTQASLARSCEILARILFKEEDTLSKGMEIVLSTKVTDLKLWTLKRIEGKKIQIEFTAYFAFKHCTHEQVTGWFKVLRKFEVDESFFVDKIGNASVFDCYSPVYPSLEEAQNSNWADLNLRELQEKDFIQTKEAVKPGLIKAIGRAIKSAGGYLTATKRTVALVTNQISDDIAF